MAEMKTYSGGCHCGRIRYEVATDLGMVASCNCSICQKRGALWTFVGADQFTLHAGDDGLTDYQFAKKVVHHLFCATCGVGSFSRGKSPKDGRDMVAVNVRCLDEVDIASLKPVPIDGKNL